MSSEMNSKELAFALNVCALAGQIAMDYFERGVTASAKADGTEVTVADKEAERIIRNGIASTFPDDAILGEEEGETAGKNSRRKWIIDPIDGTYNYARGIPIFATLLALEEDGEIVLGIVNAPARGDMYWAEKGKGAFRNGRALRVSDCSDISRAQFNFGALSRIRRDGYWNGFTKVVEQTYRQRGYGDYLSFAYVFEGKAEASLEMGVKPWDLAPMKIIVEEAGGRYSDLSGGASVYTGNCLISNGVLHDSILSALQNQS
jgi:histidinol-phosphatase